MSHPYSIITRVLNPLPFSAVLSSSAPVTTSSTMSSVSASGSRSAVYVTSTVTAGSSTTSPTNSPNTISTSSTIVPVTTAKPNTSAFTSKPTSISTSTLSSPVPGSTTWNAGKRGLGFNDIAATIPFTNTASWSYNWYSHKFGNLYPGVQFILMLWSDSVDLTSVWMKNAQAAIDAGATHILGFNEPDLSEQANMSPDRAAAAWRKHIQPFAGKVKLVSPAITNGGPPLGHDWMDRFLMACSDCTIDAIAIHIYDSATNVAYFKSYIANAGKKYGKPVWVTEFGGSGTVAQQTEFIKLMVPYLNGLASVERYAYFGDFEGTFVQNGQLLPLGKAYASAA
jgi:hypothetical protein